MKHSKNQAKATTKKTKTKPGKSITKTKTKPKRKIVALAIVLSLFGLLLISLASVYGYGVYYFQSHFGMNTTIDNHDVAYMTIEEAESLIAGDVDQVTFTVTGREGLKLVLQAKEVGLHYVSDGQVAAILDSQDPWAWPLRIQEQPGDSTSHSYGLDATKLTRYLESTGVFDPQNMRLPTDAYIQYAAGLYTIQAEDQGTTLDFESVQVLIAEKIVRGEPGCDLEAADCYIKPDIDANYPDLVAQIDDYNTYAPFRIVYDLGDKTVTLDAYTVIDWYVSNADGSKVLNMDALNGWLDDFCNRYNTLGGERVFTAARGDQIAISGGSYGWLIDKKAERNAILAAFDSRIDEIREPVYTQRAAVHADEAGQPDWGTTYIEIDQSTQKLSYFVDGSFVFQTDIVTGLPTPKRSTPNGVFYVLTRVTNTHLKGPIMENGEPEWYSFVSFWLGVTETGVGIHDASWQPWFGGNRYTYAGSHGCINLPYYAVKELFEMVEVGTPVIIHW